MDLEEELIKSYIIKDKAIEKRIVEQLASGTIEATKIPGHYKISTQGRRLMQFYRTMAPLFGLDCQLCGIQSSSESKHESKK